MSDAAHFRYSSKESDVYSSHAIILRWVGRDGNGARLLDVGTAQGILAQRFVERGFVVDGIEADPKAAAQARQWCRTVIVADLDAEAPQFEQPFEVIIYADILEHLKDPLAVLRALNRNLSPTGRIINPPAGADAKPL